MMRIVWIFLSILLVFAAACAPSVADAPSEPQAPPAEETSAPAISASPSQGDVLEVTPTTPAGLEHMVERAKEDLAKRLNIVLAQINLIEAKAVVWPDASLGCPQPGMRYQQVPEDGALIILQANGISYEYHNGGSRGLFLCQKTIKDPNPPPKLDPFNLTPGNPSSSNPDAPTPDRSIPPGEGQ